MSRQPRVFRTVTLLSAAVLLAASLSACSTGETVATGTSFDVQLADPSGAVPVALAQVMIGVDAFTMMTIEGSGADGLAPAALTDIGNDVWIGNVVDAGAGDTVEIVLPTEEELPAGVLAPVEQAFVNVTQQVDCQVDATASATVTASAFDGLTVPGLVSYAASGLSLAVVSDAALDPTVTIPDGTRLYTWLHSDSAVDVAFSGTDCGGYDADLSLEAGWNFAAWVYADAGTTLTLSDVERPDTLVVTVAGGP